jgi:shikimate kinase
MDFVMRNVQQRPKVNLYLIGFMGVGKSAVGRAVARQLRMRFLDSDWWIEQQAGMPVAEIFAQLGEAAFRALENRFMEEGHPDSGVVVSCGGGLPLQPGMREILLARGVVICLFARVETILRRTSGNTRRPLLNVPDSEARIRQLLAEREPLYMRTGVGISAEGRTIADITANVVRVYHREATRFPLTAPGGNAGA